MGWLPPTRMASLATVVSVLLACPFSYAQASPPPPQAAIPALMPPHQGHPENVPAEEDHGHWPHGQSPSVVRAPREEPATPKLPPLPASPAPVPEAGQPTPTHEQHEGKQFDGQVPDSPGCSYKVFYAMPCVQETLEQELHLILTGGGSGCQFFKRLAKDCQMPVNQDEVGVVVVPESSKFASLLRDHKHRDALYIEMYLGELLMAGEDLPSAIVTSDQERAKFVGEMLGELAVFDTVHHNDKTDPPVKKVPSPDGIIGQLRQGMQKKVSKRDQEASSSPIDLSSKVPPKVSASDNLHESEESHKFPHSHIGHVPELDYSTKSTPNPSIEAAFRSLSTGARGSSNKTSGDVLKDEIGRAVKLGYAAGFRAGTEKSPSDEVPYVLQADSDGDDSDEKDDISDEFDLMKLLMYRNTAAAKRPETNNWTIKNMPHGKQKILIFQ